MLRLSLLISSITFSLISACADTPDTVVPAKKSFATDGQNRGSNTRPVQSKVTKVVAIKFEGRDVTGKKCHLYLGFSQEHHDKSEQSHLLVKLDYTTLDGHTPRASDGQLHQYNASTGIYYAPEESSPETTLVILSLNLKDGTKALPNLLNEYIKQAKLEQYIRVELSQDTTSSDFISSLERVLESENSAELSQLAPIQLISLALAHGDHYHFPTCIGNKATRLVLTEFDLEGHDHHHHFH